MYKKHDFNIFEKQHPFVTQENIKWIKDRLKSYEIDSKILHIIKQNLKDTYDSFRNTDIRFYKDKNDIQNEIRKRTLMNCIRNIKKHLVQYETMYDIEKEFDKQKDDNSILFDYTNKNRKLPSAISKRRSKRISHMSYGFMN